jgi:non-ribosomal peptide synthetase component F
VFIPETLLVPLRGMANRHRTTLFTILLSGLNVLLSRLTGERTVLIGTSVSLREQEEFACLTGFCNNTVLYCNRLEESGTLAELISQVGRTNTEAAKYGLYPFEQLLAELDVAFSAVCAVYVNFTSLPALRQHEVADTRSRHEAQGGAYFDFNCFFNEFRNAVQISCFYRPELFEAATIENVMNQYLEVLALLTTQPEAGRLDALFPGPLAAGAQP